MSVRAENVFQWVSVTEAGRLGEVSERAVWRWIHAGIVRSKAEKRGQRETRLTNVESLPPTDPPAERAPGSTSVTSYSPDRRRLTASVPASRLNAARHEVSLDAAGLDVPNGRHYAELAEQKAARLEGEQDRVVEDMQHLRAQLERRAHEIEQHAIAEQQLRVMLVRLEETNRELAGALLQKALPPAPEVEEKPRRIRGWR